VLDSPFNKEFPMISRHGAFRFGIGAAVVCALAILGGSTALSQGGERHFLYVAEPGIRNYVEYGGVGVLVYDMDAGHRFVKRIPTFPEVAGQPPENVKGVAAHAATARLFVSTIKRVAAIDLNTEQMLWNRAYEGGADRLAVSPDGATLYVPSLEGPHWHAVEAATGNIIATVVTNSGAHNTVYGADGRYVYLAGLKSPKLAVADARTHKVVKEVGPFSNVVRPFTINGSQTLAFVNVNDLLGFEVGDIKTGKMLHRVEVTGFAKGPVKRHGCPSHGVGLTPDEKELWLSDGHNQSVHIFDATVMPPKQVATIKLRDQPGWVTFSLDGQYAYPSTGEVIDTATRKIVVALTDEERRVVQSEKVVEVVMANGRPTRTGDQFGVGRKK
jgi:DNA-binding beta-propeller fold protein YncE